MNALALILATNDTTNTQIEISHELKKSHRIDQIAVYKKNTFLKLL